MFDNIGGKIKGLAAVVCWFGIFGSIIAAIAFFVKANLRRDRLNLRES